MKIKKYKLDDVNEFIKNYDMKNIIEIKKISNKKNIVEKSKRINLREKIFDRIKTRLNELKKNNKKLIEWIKIILILFLNKF